MSYFEEEAIQRELGLLNSTLENRNNTIEWQQGEIARLMEYAVKLEGFVRHLAPFMEDPECAICKEIDALSKNTTTSRPDDAAENSRVATANMLAGRGTNSGWIALAERQPAMGECCLVFPDEGDGIGMDTFGWDGKRPIFIEDGLTHWMPLPAPPTLDAPHKIAADAPPTPELNGVGNDVTCRRCGGSGDIEVHDQAEGPNAEPFTVGCPDCKGEGAVPSQVNSEADRG